MYGDHSPFFIQNIQRKEEAMIIFTSLLTQRLFLCSMIFLERLRKNPAKPIEIKYISHFLQPSSLLFVYLMKAICKSLLYLPRCFLNPCYVILLVQICLATSLFLSRNRLIMEIEMKAFLNACCNDLLQNSWAWC